MCAFVGRFSEDMRNMMIENSLMISLDQLCKKKRNIIAIDADLTYIILLHICLNSFRREPTRRQCDFVSVQRTIAHVLLTNTL